MDNKPKHTNKWSESDENEVLQNKRSENFKITFCTQVVGHSFGK